MDNDFKQHRIFVESLNVLYASEAQSEIINYAEKNDLILPSDFHKSHYKYFGRNDRPDSHLWLITIDFLARNRTHDDRLREQIEFQIKQLET